ncbi:hypothetical protein FQN50_004664 [Emmonsiellopsis sp. PD_5]|nr:hypothetical protein FQN50_004664 [Emmonsiellopsis sp. PD_5]
MSQQNWEAEGGYVDPQSTTFQYIISDMDSQQAGISSRGHSQAVNDDVGGVMGICGGYDPAGASFASSNSHIPSQSSTVQQPGSAGLTSERQLDYFLPAQEGVTFQDDLLRPIPFPPNTLYDNNTPAASAPFSSDLMSNVLSNHPIDVGLAAQAEADRSRAFQIHSANPQAVQLFHKYIQLYGSFIPAERYIHALGVLTGMHQEEIQTWFDYFTQHPLLLNDLNPSNSGYRCLKPHKTRDPNPRGDKYFGCFDPSCGARFKKKDDLKKHMELQNPSVEYHCGHQQCYTIFSRRDKFLEHIKKKHGREHLDQRQLNLLSKPILDQKFPPQCPACQKQMVSFDAWFAHWTNIHCPRPTRSVASTQPATPRQQVVDMTPSESSINSPRPRSRAQRRDRPRRSRGGPRIGFSDAGHGYTTLRHAINIGEPPSQRPCSSQAFRQSDSLETLLLTGDSRFQDQNLAAISSNDPMLLELDRISSARPTTNSASRGFY